MKKYQNRLQYKKRGVSPLLTKSTKNYLFTASFRALPALNVGTTLAGI